MVLVSQLLACLVYSLLLLLGCALQRNCFCKPPVILFIFVFTESVGVTIVHLLNGSSYSYESVIKTSLHCTIYVHLQSTCKLYRVS